MQRPDVGQMLSEMSAQQFDLWQTYYDMGDPRRTEEFHNARLIHAQAAVWGEKGSDPLVDDFLPENIAYERMLERRRAAATDADERARETILVLGQALMNQQAD